jgi:hypothetical protein
VQPLLEETRIGFEEGARLPNPPWRNRTGGLRDGAVVLTEPCGGCRLRRSNMRSQWRKELRHDGHTYHRLHAVTESLADSLRARAFRTATAAAATAASLSSVCAFQRSIGRFFGQFLCFFRRGFRVDGGRSAR